jgi:hypothetical protein
MLPCTDVQSPLLHQVTEVDEGHGQTPTGSVWLLLQFGIEGGSYISVIARECTDRPLGGSQIGPFQNSRDGACLAPW